MSKPIHIKFDNNLPNEEVRKALLPSSVEEGGYSDSEIQETKVTGIYTPLVKLNNMVIPWEDIMSMHLSSIGFLPELSLRMLDRRGSILNIDTPGPDNHVILELIPRFDKIYKKIKLNFYIDDINIDSTNHNISLSCKYYCDKLRDSQLESFGKISTYKFYEEVAHRLRLGLCSNLEDSEDERYIYIAGDSFLDALIDEIGNGGSENIILDSWIDWWNNINIVDLRDLYMGSVDSDLKIWGNVNSNIVSPEFNDDPVEMPAIITNDYRRAILPLYTKDIDLSNSNRSNTYGGTDRAYNVFDLNRNINDSLLIQDGSGIKENIFVRYYYNGEYNSNENDGKYLYGEEYRNMFHQKIGNNTIRVRLNNICFGLMRGGKVNVEFYDDSNFADAQYSENDNMQTNAQVDDNSSRTDTNETTSLTLNKKISGQYYIVNTSIEYDRRDGISGPESHMYHYLTLSKAVEPFKYSDITKDNNI